MHKKYRPILCLFAVILAYGISALIGAGHPAEKLLHRWYGGILAIFLVSSWALMLITLRGPLEKSLWSIPVSAALSYPAAVFAYVAYFMSFEPQRFLSTLNHIQPEAGTFAGKRLFDILLLVLVVGPTVSLTWLFGAIAGVAFFSSGHLLTRFGYKL
jgi:hypothetical protein